MSKLFLPSLLLVAFNLCAQDNLDLENIPSKKIISKFEVVGGPGLLLNYGNKNLDQNRAFKLGYCVGLGVYHTFSKRWELNARVLWERNGHKTRQRVNANIGLDEVIEDELKNEYYTFTLAPSYLFGQKKKFRLGLGGYFSVLKNSNATSIEYLNGQIKMKSISNTSYEYNKYDYGTILNFSYSHRIHGKESVMVQVVDKWGFTYIAKALPYGIPEKNHVVSIVFSFIINH